MLKKVNDYQALKLLGDPRRLAILQLLMESSATLSQLGECLGVTPARVRHHLVQLESAGYIELVKTRAVRGFTEKYYRATARAYWINLALMPEPAQKGRIVVFGSHDPGLERLADWMRSDPNTPDMDVYPVGSLDGLVALRQGLCHFTGCHLFDPADGGYNTSYVRHFFPGQVMHIITLAYRQQGLLVAPGNPRAIQELVDIQREDIRFVNRKRGSGTRLWLDQKISALGVEASHVRGYTNEVNTHDQVANAVYEGLADVGLAVYAAARQAGLDFIPLFEERYDLILTDETFQEKLVAPALDHLHSGQFRMALELLGGYNLQDTGNEIHT